jgi:hypothetical protein
MDFKIRLKQAAEQGLLLFVKYALVAGLIYIIVVNLTNIISGSANGTQAAIYLNELQQKGYLPKVVNGQIPLKQDSSNEITKDSKP